MKKTIMSILTLWILVNSALFGLLIIGSEKEIKISATIIIIDDDGTPGVDCNYTIIQQGINNAYPGDTVFVRNGTYHENIILNKTLSLIGEKKENVIINGGGNGGVIYINTSWTNITGFTITGGDTSVVDSGLYLDNIQNCKIYNNNIFSNNYHGINIISSYNNNISANNVYSNNFDGIHLFSSSNNNITNNDISFNSVTGINLEGSSNNIIRGNKISPNNWYGIHIRSSSNNNLLQNNTISNNGGTGFILSSSTQNSIINNKVLSNGKGGLEISTSNNNNISRNNISSNNGRGIFLSSSSNIIIQDNIIISNNRSGIDLYTSSNNTITENNVSFNKDRGIDQRKSSNNTIKNNNVSSNENYGIILYNSITNTIINNNVTLNNGTGLWLGSSTENRIFHNNIKNNTIQAYDGTINGNYWDNGYPSGGNYWSDYLGTDFYKGPNQDIPGSDGIGDSPYVIDADSQDNYPLMQQFINSFNNYIILKQGWNLISLPLIQEEQNLTRILGSIDGWYDAVQWYSISDLKDPWKHHKVGKPFRNDLFELNETMGFWIHITNPGDTIFLYNGTSPTSNQTIQLHEGWNMVGYPSLTNHNRTTGLNNLEFGTDIDAIQWYDAATKTWHFMGPDDTFVPGRGYWVHSKVEAGWELPL